MDYQEWQQRRRVWMEREKTERSKNFAEARGHIQAAVTEQAIRELYDRLDALEAELEKKGKADGGKRA